MTSLVLLVKIDVMISPFCFDFVSIKSIPHCAVGALLFWCCCCYSCCFCHPYSVSFFRMCDYFCSVFDSSICSFCCRCLSLLVVVVCYIFVVYDCLPRGLPWRLIVRCLGIVSIDVSFWSLVSHVPVVVVPYKLFFNFCSTLLLFLFLWCCRLALSVVCLLFCQPSDTRVDLERIIVSVVLDLQLETLHDYHGTFLCLLIR